MRKKDLLSTINLQSAQLEILEQEIAELKGDLKAVTKAARDKAADDTYLRPYTYDSRRLY